MTAYNGAGNVPANCAGIVPDMITFPCRPTIMTGLLPDSVSIITFCTPGGRVGTELAPAARRRRVAPIIEPRHQLFRWPRRAELPQLPLEKREFCICLVHVRSGFSVLGSA